MTSISKYAKLLIGKERDFAVWCFKKIMGLRIDHAEVIKEKKEVGAVKFHLVRSGAVLPLSLTVDRYVALRAEFFQGEEKEKRRPAYEQLEKMYIVAEARRLHAEFAYESLVQKGEFAPGWNDLNDEEKSGYLEAAK
jgi:hypothetical protein